MDGRMKFYGWLISTLQRRRMTFEEIANEWRDATANPDEEELQLRTFHRYRKAIEAQFGISVECSGKGDGYRYYVKKDPVECDDVTEWMLSSLRLASLGDMLSYHNRVMLDTPPYHSEYLDDILAAIDKHYLLKFLYTTAYGEEKDMVLQPAFVRYFKQRWYVIGVKNDLEVKSEERRVNNSCAEADDAFANEKKRVRCLPFDRISYLKVICVKHPLTAKMKRFLTPENYYDDCFGIIRMENQEPEKIRIRAFYPEYNYIEEVPLHESQQMVKESADGMFREYTLTVRHSYDFLQELLWHGRGLMVLKPESLRQEMIGILQDMAKSYETGECLNGEQ